MSIPNASNILAYPKSPYIITKIVFLTCAISIAIVCFPVMYKHRQHRVMQFRTFPIYASLFIPSFWILTTTILRDMPARFTVSAFRFLLISEIIMLGWLISGCIAVGIRYYAFLFNTRVQGQLADRRTCTDGKFYKKVISQIRWCRYLTFEKPAIVLCIIGCPFYILVLGFPLFYSSDQVIESVMLGERTYMMSMMSIVVLAWFGFLLGK